MLAHEIEQTTATQAEIADERRTGLGGSDFAAIVGESPYATALDVWRAKVEGATTEESERMRRGQQLERVVLDWYRAETMPGHLVIGHPRRMRHPVHRWWIGQPDGLVYEPERALALFGRGAPLQPDGTVAELLDVRTGAVLTGPRPDWIAEVKTHGWIGARGYGDEGTDDIPRHIITQVTTYMGLVGVTRCDLAVLSDTHRYQAFRVHLDERLLAVLLEAGDRFWREHVIAGDPPPPDGSESYGRWIRDRYHADRRELVQRATPEQADEIAQLAALKARAKALEADIETRAQRLQKQIKEASELVDETGRVLATWRTNGTAGPKWKDAFYRMAKIAGRTDAEIDAVLEECAGKPARPFCVKLKAS